MFVLLEGLCHESMLSRRDTLDHLSVEMAIVVASTLLLLKLESSEFLALQHLDSPKETGYDQRAVSIPRNIGNPLATVVKALFVGGGSW